MSTLRIPLAGLILLAALPAHAAEEDSDWATLGRFVAIVQPFLRLALSEDPKAVEKGIDAALAGRNPEVNRAARELFEDMPPQLRNNLQALMLDAAALARRERARAAERGVDTGAGERAVQARKDLIAMGLRYYDTAQFLEAVKRDDALAVELYVAGRGVNLGARDADGRTALDIARRSGNQAIVRLLEATG